MVNAPLKDEGENAAYLFPELDDPGFEELLEEELQRQKSANAMAQFESRPLGQKLRARHGQLERSTNAYQRELVSAYDHWSHRVQRAVRQAQREGLGPDQQLAVVDGMLDNLEFRLSLLGRHRFPQAAEKALRGPLAQHRNGPEVLTAVVQKIADNEQFIKTSLIPDIRAKLAQDLQAGVAQDSAALKASFEQLRYRPAGYAGGYWSMHFEAQRAAGIAENQQRQEMGLGPSRCAGCWTPAPATARTRRASTAVRAWRASTPVAGRACPRCQGRRPPAAAGAIASWRPTSAKAGRGSPDA